MGPRAKKQKVEESGKGDIPKIHPPTGPPFGAGGKAGRKKKDENAKEDATGKQTSTTSVAIEASTPAVTLSPKDAHFARLERTVRQQGALGERARSPIAAEFFPSKLY
jgi:hypothetical protein